MSATDFLLLVLLAAVVAAIVVAIVVSILRDHSSSWRRRRERVVRGDTRLVETYNRGEPGRDVPQDPDWRPDPNQGIR